MNRSDEQKEFFYVIHEMDTKGGACVVKSKEETFEEAENDVNWYKEHCRVGIQESKIRLAIIRTPKELRIGAVIKSAHFEIVTAEKLKEQKKRAERNKRATPYWNK